MKKITVLALHLGYGGIEKCISSLVNSLSNEYEVNIISTYKIYDEPVFKINDSVKIEYLMNYGPNKKNIKKYLKEHKYLKLICEFFKSLKILYLKKKLMIAKIKKCDSDVVIATRDIHNNWLGKYGNPKSLKIGWEHNSHNNNPKYVKKILKSIQKLDYFVLVTKIAQQYYQEKTKTKCVCIPNSLDDYPTKYASLEKKNIISVGRLSYEKGYDILIDVFKLVHTKYPDWNLNIIGDGNEYEKISKKIKQNNLEKNIKLHGYQNKEYINKELFNSSIYVLPSRSESFGLVILEAFSYGLPCVAFNTTDGAKELISDNWDGYLVSSNEQMAKRICELIGNINRRVIMGANAIKKANQYNVDEIKKMWIELIER